MALAIQRGQPARGFILPYDNADEAALVDGMCIYPARTLLQVCTHLKGLDDASRIAPHRAGKPVTHPAYPDFADVKGQQQVKRALEIAACGLHSILMVGPPGSGKSMLAARFPGLLPPMSDEEALEAAAVQSLSTGFHLKNWKQRPFRSPHHTSSGVALVGGGSVPRPGEISLAHHGVLFLDELPEYSRRTLEALREPLEAGRVVIARALHAAQFPARFQLIAAMNPCPCGWRGHPVRACVCKPDQIARYVGKISGPLLDRIDLHVALPPSDPESVAGPPGEASGHVLERVTRCRQRQHDRQGKLNAALSGAELDQHCVMQADAQALLFQAMRRLSGSGRALHRALRVARTIADLEGADALAASHVAQAVQYRRPGL